MTVDLNSVAVRVKQYLVDELNSMPSNSRFDTYQRKLLSESIDSMVSEVKDGWEAVFSSQLEIGKYIESGLKANPSYNFGQGGGHMSQMFIAIHSFVTSNNIRFENASQKSAAFLIMRSKKRKGITPASFVKNVIDKKGQEIVEIISALFTYFVEVTLKSELNGIVQS
ncbi:MAG: hypothetical protein WCX48_08470 [Bacteroidales bacterium]